MSRRKVKIFTEGGTGIGLGHLARCASLYDEILKQGAEALFYVFGKTQGLELIKSRTVIEANWMNINFINENVNKDDFCIVDSYLVDRDVLEVISSTAQKVLFIDDMNRLNYPKGIVINPSLDLGDIQYPANVGCEYFWGSDYVILRGPFKNVERDCAQKNVKTVLITMGGSDIKNVTPLIVAKICHLNPLIRFNIVIGSAFNNIEEIKQVLSSNCELHFNVDESEMKKLMCLADLAITAAGQTVFELIATKTPFIPIQVVDNQSNNMVALKKFKFVTHSLEVASDTFCEEIAEIFMKLLAVDIRQELIEKYQLVIDGNGCERIIEKLFECDREQISFRRVSTLDCELLFEWANDDLVRRNAFTTNKIDFEEHLKWFQGKIKNDQTLMYLILKDNDAVGQIRVDLEGEIGMISYSIDSKYRGQGFGTQALQEIHLRVKADYKEIKRIIGRVKIENLPSRKAFEKADFELVRTSEYIEYYKILSAI